MNDPKNEVPKFKIHDVVKCVAPGQYDFTIGKQYVISGFGAKCLASPQWDLVVVHDNTGRLQNVHAERFELVPPVPPVKVVEGFLDDVVFRGELKHTLVGVEPGKKYKIRFKKVGDAPTDYWVAPHNGWFKQGSTVADGFFVGGDHTKGRLPTPSGKITAVYRDVYDAYPSADKLTVNKSYEINWKEVERGFDLKQSVEYNVTRDDGTKFPDNFYLGSCVARCFFVEGDHRKGLLPAPVPDPVVPPWYWLHQPRYIQPKWTFAGIDWAAAADIKVEYIYGDTLDKKGNVVPPPVERKDWVQTFTGKKFFPTDPKPEDISIVDIAKALSMQCRFAGHVSKFYSVAEHSVRVSRLVERLYSKQFGKASEVEIAKVALGGLLHDASEAYFNDIPGPLKGLPELKGYVELEKNLQEAILKWFGCYTIFGIAPWVEKADKEILETEALQLKSPVHPDWAKTFSASTEKDEYRGSLGWNSAKAEYLFLRRFEELLGKLSNNFNDYTDACRRLSELNTTKKAA